MQTDDNGRSWFDAAAVDDGAEFDLNRGVGKPSVGGNDASEMARLRRQTDAKVSESLTGALYHLSKHFGAIADHISTLSQHEAEALLAQSVGTLISVSRTFRPDGRLTSSRNQPIRLIVEKFIEANLSSPDMSPMTIARDLEIPRSTLYKAFVHVGGISKYIQERRLVIAMSLLAHREECRSLGQIASSLGFTNSATFSKAFRKRFGLSPRSMRTFGTDHVAPLRQCDEHRIDRGS